MTINDVAKQQMTSDARRTNDGAAINTILEHFLLLNK